MQCPKCQHEMLEAMVTHQMECRNQLFCFEEVPALQCGECGHVFLAEDTLEVLISRVHQLAAKATISYHRCRWPKAGAGEQQPELLAQLMETINKSVRKI
jgi:YgiT-type zinc finger domain-containing protein